MERAKSIGDSRCEGAMLFVWDEKGERRPLVVVG
jgi:hypothetical protein